MNGNVVITGFGGLTASGTDIESSWNAIKQGHSGIAPSTQCASDAWEYPMAAEIKEYNPRKMLYDKKLLKVISKQDVLGIHAASQAVEHSGIIPYRDSLSETEAFNDKTGVYVGSPGNKFQQQYEFMPLFAKAKKEMPVFAQELFNTVHPMWLLKILPNNVLAYTGIQYGFKGANQNITNHAVSGLQAIMEAAHAIQSGQIDRAVVVAYDIACEPQGVVYYGELGTLSSFAIKSFDADRDGTILGEGAGAIVLESQTSAQARHAKIYGEILAGASTTEAHGIFTIDENGSGLDRTVAQTLSQARISPSDVGLVTAHANGNKLSDSTEAQVIQQQFGNRTLPVTGFKWSIGHTIAAAGVLDTIFTLLALREGQAPGIATLAKVADDCQPLAVSAQSQATTSSIGLIHARGFSSMNAALLIRAQ